jgi:hypothetical protein
MAEHQGVRESMRRPQPVKLGGCPRWCDIDRRIVERAVSHDDGVEPRDEGEGGLEVAVRRRQLRPCPLQGPPSEPTSRGSGQTLQCHQVVVTGDADAVETCDSLDALVRMGSVAHQISRAEVPVDIFGGQHV